MLLTPATLALPLLFRFNFAVFKRILVLIVLRGEEMTQGPSHTLDGNFSLVLSSASAAGVLPDPSIYMPLKISIWDDRSPNFDDVLLAEVNFEAIEIYQSVGHMKSETLPNGAV
jgi:hypothetical protein